MNLIVIFSSMFLNGMVQKVERLVQWHYFILQFSLIVFDRYVEDRPKLRDLPKLRGYSKEKIGRIFKWCFVTQSLKKRKRLE